MAQMPFRRDVADEAPDRVRPERAEVPEREVVIAGRMRAGGRAAVIAMRARAAGRDAQMVDRCLRLVADASAGSEDAPREVALEAIRGAGEVLVESTDGEHPFAIDGEIAGHDVLHVARRV